MDIQKTLSETRTMAEFLPIVRNASAEFSFWGARYVSVEGYDGSLSVDALAERIEELVDKNYEFDETERACGKEITSLIDRIYVDSDKAHKHACFLSKLFYIIRQVLANIFYYKCNPPMTRYLWEYCSENKLFEYYTRQQYINVFKIPPIDEDDPDWTQSNSLDRWHEPKPHELEIRRNELDFERLSKTPFIKYL